MKTGLLHFDDRDRANDCDPVDGCDPVPEVSRSTGYRLEKKRGRNHDGPFGSPGSSATLPFGDHVRIA